MGQQLLLVSGSSFEHNSRQFNRLSIDQVKKIDQNKNIFNGVDIDIRHIKQIYKDNSMNKILQAKIVKSSKNEYCLLSRSAIVNQIISFFKDQNILIKILYFSGLGTKDGYLQLQTTQHPEGQKFTICQLVQMWRKFRPKSEASMQIFLDCNYSGKIVHKYYSIKNMELLDNIAIYASSDQNNKSLDVQRFGGLLICSWWANHCREDLTQIQHQELKQKFESRNPLCVIWNKEKQCKEIKQLKWLFNLEPIFTFKPQCVLI